MTTKQATGIALKFFAIYLLFNLLMVIPSLVSIGYYGNQPSILTRFVIPLIGIIVGLIAIGLLWKVSNSFIKKTGTDEEPIINDMTTDGVMKTVLACMGLYFALQGIISFLHVYASARSYAQHSTAGFQLDLNFLIVPCVKFALGCFLIAKPKQWVKVIRSIGEK